MGTNFLKVTFLYQCRIFIEFIYIFSNEVTKQKNDISDGIGTPDWLLTIYLFLAWVVIFLIIVRGVRSSGKASYFLALFPYLILIILLIRAVTLEGSIDGIIFFFKPQWGELLNPKVRKQKCFNLIFFFYCILILTCKILVSIISFLYIKFHFIPQNDCVKYLIP